MENKLKQEEYGISVKLFPSSSIEIASEDNASEKLWILWRHVKKNANANRVT